MPPGFQLIAAPDAAAMEQVYRLRVRAWRARNASFPDVERWRDPEDEGCLHWCVVDGKGTVAAAARLSVHKRFAEIPDAEIYPPALSALTGPVGSINRMIVGPEHGGLGLARALDEARITAASNAGCRVIVGATSSGPQRLRSLEGLGFRTAGVALPMMAGPLAQTDGETTVILMELEAGRAVGAAGPEQSGGRGR